jgi:hypothetical protein
VFTVHDLLDDLVECSHLPLHLEHGAVPSVPLLLDVPLLLLQLKHEQGLILLGHMQFLLQGLYQLLSAIFIQMFGGRDIRSAEYLLGKGGL